MKQQDRPLLLVAALTLSAVGNSIAILTFWGISLFYSRAIVLIEQLTNVQSTQSLSPLYFAAFGALYLLSLTGIVYMWKWRRTGFYLYLTAQIAIILMPLFRMSASVFSSANLIFTLLFVAIYAVYLKSFR
ncbi:hypothetical protein [Gaoshiqia sp. Z1-71]|uniref:hypothetical protein n=1 Tax=Gaoshiqia hydrogeniformans TaxID=3290090 RepID=UPI003BF90F67